MEKCFRKNVWGFEYARIRPALWLETTSGSTTPFMPFHNYMKCIVIIFQRELLSWYTLGNVSISTDDSEVIFTFYHPNQRVPAWMKHIIYRWPISITCSCQWPVPQVCSIFSSCSILALKANSETNIQVFLCEIYPNCLSCWLILVWEPINICHIGGLETLWFNVHPSFLISFKIKIFLSLVLNLTF